ncbi:MAG: AbrB/MazE/SpoVT family DNA-binding domain-containing protein [Thaumarchaeota archaeon]|nr:AbrB/MazE/SpoVT family DNA-binding domain-containing protein [Nitrososphaerota archaeon]
MIQKIHARSVMRMGREPRHSLMVTIPREICNALQIEKGNMLYFKLEGNKFAVSKDSKFEHTDGNDNTTTVESIAPTKEKKMDISMTGVSLSDLQY